MSRTAIRMVPLVVAVLVSFVVLFSPGSAVPAGLPHIDKVIHAGLFGALAFTSLLAGARSRLAIAWTVAYAVLSEILQATLPINRDGSWQDCAADVAGALLAAGLWAWWASRAARSGD